MDEEEQIKHSNEWEEQRRKEIEEAEQMTTDPYKREGIKKWFQWKSGYQRGHYKIGREIIERYDIKEEVDKIKRDSHLRGQRLANKRFREFNPLSVARSNHKYYIKNKDKIKEYKRSEKYKSKRRETAKLKSDLLRAYKQDEKWLD